MTRDTETSADGPRQTLASPCVKICRIDPGSRICAGCRRTLDEIAAWASFTELERQAVLGALPGRRR